MMSVWVLPLLPFIDQKSSICVWRILGIWVLIAGVLAIRVRGEVWGQVKTGVNLYMNRRKRRDSLSPGWAAFDNYGPTSLKRRDL